MNNLQTTEITLKICEMLKNKTAQLEAAKATLSNWHEYDSRREGGSGAQDRRHEEMGERARNRVYYLEEEVRQLQALLG